MLKVALQSRITPLLLQDNQVQVKQNSETHLCLKQETNLFMWDSSWILWNKKSPGGGLWEVKHIVLLCCFSQLEQKLKERKKKNPQFLCSLKFFLYCQNFNWSDFNPFIAIMTLNTTIPNQLGSISSFGKRDTFSFFFNIHFTCCWFNSDCHFFKDEGYLLNSLSVLITVQVTLFTSLITCVTNELPVFCNDIVPVDSHMTSQTCCKPTYSHRIDKSYL